VNRLHTSRMRRVALASLLGAAATAFAGTAIAAVPTALSSSDVKVLVAPPSRGVRIVALWALDCAYCEENLTALATFQRAHADVDLVFVATDPIGQRDALAARLAGPDLASVPSRAYTDATPDRVNYLIDPEWGGETPRTLVIHADGSRRTFSGAIDARRIASLVN